VSDRAQRNLLILFGVIVVVALAGLLLDPVGDCLTGVKNQFWAQTRDGLTQGSIYAMLALGYTMVYGVLQLINFAHSEVFMVSVFAMLHFYQSWFGVTEPAGGLTLILLVVGGLAISMSASGVTAVAVERFAYRPLRRRHAPRLAFLISAIGASLFIQYFFNLMDGQHDLLPGIFQDVAQFLVPIVGIILLVLGIALFSSRRKDQEGEPRGAPLLSSVFIGVGGLLVVAYLLGWVDDAVSVSLPNWAGASPRPVPEVMDSSVVFSVFGADVNNKRILVILGAGLMLFILDRFVTQTRMGRGIRAVAQDSQAASIMGVNIDRVVVTTFLVGGLMAGAAGYLYVTVLGVPAFWFMGFIPGIKAFTAAVLGGIGNIRGAMLGGLLLGLVEAYSVACYGSDWVDVTAFVVLVLVLLFRPSGILGEEVGH
jgi:branched-chain amino acid transport system permease protein